METIKKTSNLSKTEKRRLRRLRRANMPAPVIEQKQDEPRLSKTAKRKLRMKRKNDLLVETENYILLRSGKGNCDPKTKDVIVKLSINKEKTHKNVAFVECKEAFSEETVKQKVKKIKEATLEITNEAVKGSFPEGKADIITDVSGPVADKSDTVAAHGDKENNCMENNFKRPKKKPSRYVLFVGNIAYSSTKESLAAHFSTTDHLPKDIRLIMQEKSTTLNRGFAYLEFASEEGYLDALKLHHSFLDGRRINVEYSTLTKGKNAKPKSFVKKKDLKLKALLSKQKTRVK